MAIDTILISNKIWETFSFHYSYLAYVFLFK